jgi:hypothetical protein
MKRWAAVVLRSRQTVAQDRPHTGTARSVPLVSNPN